MANEQKDVFKEVSDKLANALKGLTEAKSDYAFAAEAVAKAKRELDAQAGKVSAVEAAVGELHRVLKAHVEGALGVEHKG